MRDFSSLGKFPHTEMITFLIASNNGSLQRKANDMVLERGEKYSIIVIIEESKVKNSRCIEDFSHAE